jgi:hypothetical protein
MKKVIDIRGEPMEHDSGGDKVTFVYSRDVEFDGYTRSEYEFLIFDKATGKLEKRLLRGKVEQYYYYLYHFQELFGEKGFSSVYKKDVASNMWYGKDGISDKFGEYASVTVRNEDGDSAWVEILYFTD